MTCGVSLGQTVCEAPIHFISQKKERERERENLSDIQKVKRESEREREIAAVASFSAFEGNGKIKNTCHIFEATRRSLSLLHSTGRPLKRVRH